MSSDVAKDFVLLANGPVPTGSEIATRQVGTDQAGLRVGIDKDGFRHLLVRVPEALPVERSSAALTLDARTLLVDGDPVLFADLKCSDKRLSLVFERLVFDVVARIDAGEVPHAALPRSLAEWRDLFRAGTHGFSMEQAVGLIGELHVLERLAGSIGQSDALAAWWGPDGHPHDFYSSAARAIEVKSTRSLEGNRIHISNIVQLDPSDLSDLHLAVVRLKPDKQAPTLDERITALLKTGFPAAGLLAKVEAAGHVYESPVQFNTQFAVTSDKWWTVGENFPGVRAARLIPPAQKGVSNIKYELSLDSVGAALSAKGVDELIHGWRQHG